MLHFGFLKVLRLKVTKDLQKLNYFTKVIVMFFG